MNDELLSLLLALDGVAQSPRYHPEGCALFHSLQVFDLARSATSDVDLWSAALFHDVGKAIDGPSHDEVGADLLEGLVPDRVVWLVRHHLDLLRDPRRSRRRFHGSPELRDLELLRSWDLRGRSPHARTLEPEDAFALLRQHHHDTALMNHSPDSSALLSTDADASFSLPHERTSPV